MDQKGCRREDGSLGKNGLENGLFTNGDRHGDRHNNGGRIAHKPDDSSIRREPRRNPTDDKPNNREPRHNPHRDKLAPFLPPERGKLVR